MATTFSVAASSRCCPIASASLLTILPRSKKHCDRAMLQPLSSSRFKAKASIYPRSIISKPLRNVIRCRRDPNRPGTHRPFSRGRTLERRAGHGAHLRVPFRRPCAGRRGSDAAAYFRKDFQPHGSGGGAWVHLREERLSDGLRNRNARRAQIRRADRE